MSFRSNRRKTDIARAGRWRRGILLTVGISAGLYLVGSFLFGRLGVQSFLELRRTDRQLAQEISSLETRNRHLLDEADALRHDPFRIEKLAREQLGMVREGEVIYQFQDKAK